MSSSRDQRYEEIMRRIAQLRADKAVAPKREAQNTLSQILTDLDAWGKLVKLRQMKVLNTPLHGPKVVSGLMPSPWVGVIAWRRGAGYYGYKILQIVGVWAQGDADDATISVAWKSLAYNAPTYEAEAYHKLIRRGFDFYYSGDASPPSEGRRLLSLTYNPEDRLDVREQVRATLFAWATHVS